MKIKNISSKGLERVFSIDVEAIHIEEKIRTKLMELSKSIRMPGFRPGKVPISLLKTRFGQDVSGEAIKEFLDEATKKVMDDEKIRPVMQPKVDLEKYEDGKPLKAKIKMEIMPEIKHTDLTKLKLNKYIADVTDKEISESLNRIAKQNEQTKKVEEDRKCKKSDTVVIDFVGKLKGEKFEGGEGKGHHLLLGSNSFIPGFEEGLIGLKINQEKTLKLAFPKDYGVEKLSGQKVEFDVKIMEIRESQKVKIDDDFAKSLGLESLKDLREAISKQIQSQHSDITRSKIKLNLLDILAEKHSFELPKTMIEQEYKSVCHSLKKENKNLDHNHNHEHDHDHDNNNSLPEPDEGMTKKEKDDAKNIAERRVKLGLLVGEIGRLNNLEVSEQEIESAIMVESKKYPGQEKQVLDYFKNNKLAAQQLASPIFEDKVVDFILEMADVKEKKVDVETLYKNDDEISRKPSEKKTVSKPKKINSK